MRKWYHNLSLQRNAFEQAQKSIMSLSTTKASSTPKVASRMLYDNLFVTNPGFGWILGNSKNIEHINLEEIKVFHKKLYNPSNLILTISGNLSIDKVMKLVKTCFGGTWGNA